MKRVACITLIIGSFAASGCAHHGGTPVSNLGALSAPRPVSFWTGEVRIAAGSSHEDLQGEDVVVVVSAVEGLLAQAGVPAQVQCLEHDGDMGTRGAFHARIRVDFPTKLSLEQKYEALGLLEGLKPAEAAYLEPTVPAPRASSPIAAQAR